jgi:hypothetical protein
MAVFLEQHAEEHGSHGDKQAKVRVAYRTFHPQPVQYTRSVECVGGTVGDHDPVKKLAMMAGRSGARRYRTGIVPDAVSVEGLSGTQVNAKIAFARTRLQLDGEGEAQFSVVFPEDEDLECSCC